MLELQNVRAAKMRGQEPFLDDERQEEDGEGGEDEREGEGGDEVTRGQAWCLYLSHFLSMWNSRMYEFGAILFIQSAFPGNLTASSINGIAETISVFLFSSALGRWVDHSPTRLRPLLVTITTNRLTVLISCALWFLILTSTSLSTKKPLFAFVLLLGMVEKLSRMTNILSMERDWVPTLAPPDKEGEGKEYGLTHLNTIMRRIDMLCKLMAPLAISTFVSAVAPIKAAVVGVAVTSALSWGVEYWGVLRVWRGNARLRVRKEKSAVNTPVEVDVEDEESIGERSYLKGPSSPRTRLFSLSTVIGAFDYLRTSFHSHVEGLRYFYSTSVWLPSICVAVLHASVLSYGGTLITWLLNAGFSLKLITIARAFGSIFEIGSTFIFPWAVGYLCRKKIAKDGVASVNAFPKTQAQEVLLARDSDSEDLEAEDTKNEPRMRTLDGAVVRVGLWGICGLLINLIPVLFSLFYLDSALPPPSQNPASTSPPPSISSPFTTHPIPALLLVSFLSLSLLGRWTYDLATTQLTQTLIPSSRRSGFGGTEMAIVSCVSLTHWVAAVVWHEQSDFKWLALGSFFAVGAAVGAYGAWVWWWEGAGSGGRGGSGRKDEDYVRVETRLVDD